MLVSHPRSRHTVTGVEVVRIGHRDYPSEIPGDDCRHGVGENNYN